MPSVKIEYRYAVLIASRSGPKSPSVRSILPGNGYVIEPVDIVLDDVVDIVPDQAGEGQFSVQGVLDVLLDNEITGNAET